MLGRTMSAGQPELSFRLITVRRIQLLLVRNNFYYFS